MCSPMRPQQRATSALVGARRIGAVVVLGAPSIRWVCPVAISAQTRAHQSAEPGSAIDVVGPAASASLEDAAMEHDAAVEPIGQSLQDRAGGHVAVGDLPEAGRASAVAALVVVVVRPDPVPRDVRISPRMMLKPKRRMKSRSRARIVATSAGAKCCEYAPRIVTVQSSCSTTGWADRSTGRSDASRGRTQPSSHRR